MKSSWKIVVLGCLGGFAASGCITDVGECDPIAARRIVFHTTRGGADLESGTPMYEGQAIVHQSCGAGQNCHSADAVGTERRGVPARMDFDVDVVCRGGACRPFVPPPSHDPTYDDAWTEYEQMALLEASQRRVLRWAGEIIDDVTYETMPPGRIGRAVSEFGPNYTYVDFTPVAGLEIHTDGRGSPCPAASGTCNEGEVRKGYEIVDPWPTLPRLTSEDAGERRASRELLRNWLACGAPVVESAPIGANAGANCNDAEDPNHVGDCVVAMPPDLTVPEANWDSIYEYVVQPLCGTACHSPERDPQTFDNTGLDFATVDAAYDSLVGRGARTGTCQETASTMQFADLIPAAVNGTIDYTQSFFYAKLAYDDADVCGSHMPPGFPVFPPSILDPIRLWITSGAPR